jgi:uncharacterized phosphosugar-binding protein
MDRRSALSLIPFSCAALAGNTHAKIPPKKFLGPKESGGTIPIGIEYVRRVQAQLKKIRLTQAENMLEASYSIARTVMSGGTCWCTWDMGHNNAFDMMPNRPANPGIVTLGYDSTKSRDGDLYLTTGGSNSADFETKDIIVVGGPQPWGMDAKLSDLIVRDSAKIRLRPYADIWIETGISTLGAIMDIPGSPAPCGPTSGIYGMIAFWMMQSDACRILARDGYGMPVMGDEPELTGTVEYADLNQPLMDDYFDDIMRQMGMIGTEYGNIMEICRMAVDSVLDGGKVFCYSRYRNSLAVEGQTRRGGLALTRGLHYNASGDDLVSMRGTFDGDSKDLVIMGLFQPEDEYDLRALDIFRKRKMKVASIGPMTRDLKIPAGRTVPKETDVHVGRMCDTYGRFALPGFNRKVCPTSGALQNQIFWALCLEIAMEIVRRTGNAPGIYFSAAVKGGTEHMHRVQLLADERGY